MSKLPIITYPDPRLKVNCAPVTVFDSSLEQIIQNLADTLYQTSNGIGLAAPQVAILARITVVDLSEQRNELIHLVNPRIVWRAGTTSSEEGCLSIPDYRDTVRRDQEIVVQAQDKAGKEFELKADGLMAICIQHEIDHLDGVLFIDRLSRLKRELFKRWFKKYVRDGSE